jgi:predicted acetyltransferase
MIVNLAEISRLSSTESNVALILQSQGRHAFHYLIQQVNSGECVGRCELRTGHSLSLYYYGNIGYRVSEEYRGHGYAYQASVLLMDLAKKCGMDYIIITVSPENTPSKKTCEKLNGQLLETANVPIWHPLYKDDQKVKLIYRYDL